MEKNKLLLDFAETLKKNGFNVFVNANQKSPSYIKFEDKNGNLGYCQSNDLGGGLDFSTVHKPNKKTGTGYRMGSNVYEPTIDHAKSAFTRMPHWASSSDWDTIKKYKNMADYMEHETVLKFKQL